MGARLRPPEVSAGWGGSEASGAHFLARKYGRRRPITTRTLIATLLINFAQLFHDNLSFQHIH